MTALIIRSSAVQNLFTDMQMRIKKAAEWVGTPQATPNDGVESQRSMKDLQEAYAKRRRKINKERKRGDESAVVIASLRLQQSAWCVARRYKGRHELEREWRAVVEVRSTIRKEVEMEYAIMVNVRKKQIYRSPQETYYQSVGATEFEHFTRSILENHLCHPSGEQKMHALLCHRLHKNLCNQATQRACKAWSETISGWTNDETTDWPMKQQTEKNTRNPDKIQSFANCLTECLQACRVHATDRATHTSEIAKHAAAVLDEFRRQFVDAPVRYHPQQTWLLITKAHPRALNTPAYTGAPTTVTTTSISRKRQRQPETPSPSKRARAPFRNSKMMKGIQVRMSNAHSDTPQDVPQTGAVSWETDSEGGTDTDEDIMP